MSSPTDPPLEAPPRKAHFRRGIRNLRRAYRMVFVLVIVVFGGWAGLNGLRWYHLAYRVQTADGTILRKYTVARPPGQEQRLEYSFRAGDGTPIHADSAVALTVYDKITAGQAVPVIYLPENPKVEHWLFDNEVQRSNVMYLTIGHALAALLAAIILRVVEGPLGRELRLARNGVVALGQIVTVGKPRGRRGVVKITYTFRTAVGASIEGTCNLPRRFPAHTLEPGTPISVLYDPKKPRVHKPRLALGAVEFGDVGKAKSPEA